MNVEVRLDNTWSQPTRDKRGESFQLSRRRGLIAAL
jgi:hypothetical protein